MKTKNINLSSSNKPITSMQTSNSDLLTLRPTRYIHLISSNPSPSHALVIHFFLGSKTPTDLFYHGLSAIHYTLQQVFVKASCPCIQKLVATSLLVFPTLYACQFSGLRISELGQLDSLPISFQ